MRITGRAVAVLLFAVAGALGAAPAGAWNAPGRIAWPAGGPSGGERRPYSAAVQLPDGTIAIASSRTGDPLSLRWLAEDGGELRGPVRVALPPFPPTWSASPIALLGQEGGRLVAALTAPVDPLRTLLVGLRADGTLDPSFGADGLVTSRATPGGVALAPDDRIVLGGRRGGRWTIERLTADGIPDPTWGGDGLLAVPGAGGRDAGGQAVAMLPDGRIVALGTVGRATTALARLLADGRADPSFHGGRLLRPGLPAAFALAALPDGTAAVGTLGGIARVTPTGEPDAGFARGGTATTGGSRPWSLVAARGSLLAYRPPGFAPFPGRDAVTGEVREVAPTGLGRRIRVRTGFGGGYLGARAADGFDLQQLLPLRSGGWLALGATGVIRIRGHDAGLEETSAFQGAAAALDGRFAPDTAFAADPSPPPAARVASLQLERGRGSFPDRLLVRLRSSVPALVRARIALPGGGALVAALPAYTAGVSLAEVFLAERVARRLRTGVTVGVRLRLRDVLGRRARRASTVTIRRAT